MTSPPVEEIIFITRRCSSPVISDLPSQGLASANVPLKTRILPGEPGTHSLTR